jgi:hypothetical protein
MGFLPKQFFRLKNSRENMLKIDIAFKFGNIRVMPKAL